MNFSVVSEPDSVDNYEEFPVGKAQNNHFLVIDLFKRAILYHGYRYYCISVSVMTADNGNDQA